MNRRTCIAIMAAAGLLLPTTAAVALEQDQCVPHPGQPATDPTYETVVVTEAWTETIEHPAVTRTVHHPAVYEDRVTAVEYKKHTPKKGWTYRWFPPSSNTQGWTPTGNVKTERVKVSKAWTETVVVKPAWTEVIEHPAVTETITHPGQPAVDPVVCDDEPTEPPVGEPEVEDPAPEAPITTPGTPDEPVDTPDAPVTPPAEPVQPAPTDVPELDQPTVDEPVLFHEDGTPVVPHVERVAQDNPGAVAVVVEFG